MAGHSEERPKETTSYRSPWRVLARAFEKSRDLWKSKYKTLQERLKAFRTEARDLRRCAIGGEPRQRPWNRKPTNCVPSCSSKSSSPPAPSRRLQPVLTQLSS